ncbi:MAG: hypothetical protein JWN62_3120 [Acidimicrobiales bacterium]|nr:hypothetical protein [Acidimicrobiales bacterium]
MKQGKCEFDALIGAQGVGYRAGVWVRSRRCVAINGLNFASVGLIAMIVTGTVAFPMLFWSVEQDLVRLAHP